MRLTAFICGLLAFGLCSANAAPITVQIDKVIDSSELAAPINLIAPAINDLGNTVFQTEGAFRQRTLWAVIDGELRMIADSVSAVSVGNSFDINNGNQIAYNFGAPTSAAGTVSYIIDEGGEKTVAADSSGPLSLFPIGVTNELSLNEDGFVAFRAATDITPNFFTGGYLAKDGEVEEVAPLGTTLFVSSPIDVNDSGDVVFLAFESDPSPPRRSVIVSSDGAFETIATIEASSESIFLRPLINNVGQVVYTTDTPVGLGAIRTITLASGGMLIDLDIPDTIIPVAAFGLNDLGDVLFTGSADGSFALNIFSEGVVTPLIRVGDTLDGRVIAGLFAGINSLNNNREVAFLARFSDLSTGIYIARFDPASEIPIPPALAFFGVGVFAIRLVQRKRR